LETKDASFWDTFLSEKFVGWGSSGKLDKASATKEYTGADCEIKSYALSDEQMSPLGRNAAVITDKATLTAHAAGKRCRQTIGQRAFTFATTINGKEPSTLQLRLSIQKRLL